MELAISNIAWKGHEDERIYDLLRNAAFSGIEIAPALLTKNNKPFNMPPEDLRAIGDDLLNRYGLKIISMQSLLFGTQDLQLFKGRESRKMMVEHLKKSIEFAHHLGIKNLVFGSPKNRLKDELDTKLVKNIAIEFFTELADYSEKFNTTMSLEANPIAYGCDFITDNESAVDLIKEVSHNHFKLNYDFGTVILNGENHKDFLDNNLDVINHIHFSVPQLSLFPGSFADFFIESMLDIKKSGYSKCVSVEMRAVSDEDNFNNVKEAVSFFSESL